MKVSLLGGVLILVTNCAAFTQHVKESHVITHPPLSSSSLSRTIDNAYRNSIKTHLNSVTTTLRGGGGGVDDNINSKKKRSFVESVKSFASKQSFLLSMTAAVSFASIFPQLGVDGGILRPELVIGKFGVTIIFLISGLSLKLSELTEAIANIKLNVLVQGISFLVWPLFVGLPLRSFLGNVFPLLSKPLLDSLLILTCLPTTVNMCVILTNAANGAVASALCNAVIGNLLGIFVTPALLLRFFGASIELPFQSMVVKLVNKVLLPVAAGQALRKTPIKEFYLNNKGSFKLLQEWILISIVWNAFCNAFSKGLGLSVSSFLVLMTILPSLHTASLFALYKFFDMKIFGFSKQEAVAATFTASHKTLAFGLPLVNTVFAGNPNLAVYCAPIMIIHPLQLVLGSIFAPRFSKLIEDGAEHS